MGSVVGSYQIIKKLGEGGMGAVYLAQHTLLGRRAALKMLLPMLSARPDVVNRFFNEARATTSISDPGIVQIFDFGYHTDGSAYIVMEFLEGEPLDVRLAKLGRMPVADALRLTRQVATSLAAAHAANIVHRDLKPENIYLVRDAEVASGERPKILDFGIAKLSDDHPGKVKTHTGALMGTPTYMSPEQCRGASELDHRSDIYALGCMLFHLVAGRPPFEGEGIGDIIAAHLREPAPPLSSRVAGIAPNVDALLARCLAKRPEDRYQTMHELAAEIGRALPHPTSPGGYVPGPGGYVGAGATPVPGYSTTGAPIHVPAPTPMPTPMPTPAPPSPPFAPAPTTLGSGAGQVTPAARPVRWVLPLIAIVILGGGGLMTAVALRGGGATAVTQPGAVQPPPPASAPDAAASNAAASNAASPDAAASNAAVPDAGAPPPDAPEALPVAAPEAAATTPTTPTTKPAPGKPKRPKPRPRTEAGSSGSSSDGCDRRIDVDCDGIPDVR